MGICLMVVPLVDAIGDLSKVVPVAVLDKTMN